MPITSSHTHWQTCDLLAGNSFVGEQTNRTAVKSKLKLQIDFAALNIQGLGRQSQMQLDNTLKSCLRKPNSLYSLL